MYTKREKRIFDFAKKMEVVVETKRDGQVCEELVVYVKPRAHYDSWLEDDYEVHVSGATRDQVKAIRKIMR